MRASALARDTRTVSSAGSGVGLASGTGFICAGIGSTCGTATTSTGAGGSGSGWACTGSSSEMDGGGLPCVAQPENSTVEARSITGKADLRKRSFMVLLLRFLPVRGSTTGR